MTSILALDQGTTGSTALVIHQDGTIQGRGYREIPQHFPAPGQVEHDPEDLYQATVAAAREAIAASGAQPAGIGITNQRETVVLWDRQTLQPVHRAIVWQDRRTTDRCRALKQEGREDWVRERTGLMLDPYFSATKLEWLLRNPDLRRRAERGELAVGTVDSWLIARLSGGVHVTDRTNASRTMLYALDDGAWDPELCTLFHIPPGLLPELGPSSGVVAETGVFGRDMPVAGVAGDQQAALFGQGCVAPGSAKSTYGTGAFLLLQAGPHRPAASPGLLTTVACGPRGEPTFALEGSVFIAGAAIQWLRDGLGIITSAAESEGMARSVPDSGGVSFVPAFVGLGSPHWEPDARGTITGLTRGTTRAHLVRAALEAMAFGTGELLETMLNGTGHRATALRVDGGAAGNDWLMQFQADLLGIPVERPAVVETTALGAGLLAGLAVGVWPSVEGFLDRLPWERFTPAMGQPERDLLRGGWQRAVNAALAWAQAAPRPAPPGIGDRF